MLLLRRLWSVVRERIRSAEAEMALLRSGDWVLFGQVLAEVRLISFVIPLMDLSASEKKIPLSALVAGRGELLAGLVQIAPKMIML